jgi:[ribosomal protein S18]-alanine N-acetyltransferase
MAAHIEAVGPEAAALLAEIHAEAFPANQAWGAAALAPMLALPGHFGLVAISQDQPLGFALARAQGPEAEIVTIAVRPGVRGQGFGRLLLASVMAEAARRGRNIPGSCRTQRRCARALRWRRRAGGWAKAALLRRWRRRLGTSD